MGGPLGRTQVAKPLGRNAKPFFWSLFVNSVFVPLLWLRIFDPPLGIPSREIAASNVTFEQRFLPGLRYQFPAAAG